MPLNLPIVPYKISEAIAREEGFYRIDIISRAKRNNNPGNLEYDDFTQSMGATSGDPRFAVFPSVDLGWNALCTLLRNRYKGETIDQLVPSYAPETENDVKSYQNNLVAWTELTHNTVIDEYI